MDNEADNADANDMDDGTIPQDERWFDTELANITVYDDSVIQYSSDM